MQYEISIQAMLNPSGKKQETELNTHVFNLNVQIRDDTYMFQRMTYNISLEKPPMFITNIQPISHCIFNFCHYDIQFIQFLGHQKIQNQFFIFNKKKSHFSSNVKVS
jgi:hypothetical protein